MKNLIQKLKDFGFYNYLLCLIILANLVTAYGAFRMDDIDKGFDKLTIAIFFADMFIYLRLNRKAKELTEDLMTLSDMKTKIIEDQNEEIEALQQENAKLKADWDLIK